MTQIIRLKQATGAQLQQAAKHARLIEVANMPYGFGNAYYSACPSPMQEQILRKGLQAAGINYLKVTEEVHAATPEDLFPDACKVALRNFIREATIHAGGTGAVRTGVAGKVLYANVPAEDDADAKRCAREMARKHGFQKAPSFFSKEGWMKAVRFKRGLTFVAAIEVDGPTLRLSVYKGA